MTDASPSSEIQPVAQRHQHFLTAMLVLAAFGVMYYGTFVRMVATWRASDGAHGPLILLVSLYLIWIQKGDFKELPVRPAFVPGVVLTCLGCFMLFTGKLSNTFLLQQVSMVPTLMGVVWLVWGFSFLKKLFLPIGYLVFLTGLVEELLGNASIYLQIVSAWIGAKLLIITGMPVLHQGTIIDLPHISLEVVKACSGINHLVALMALSIPLATFTQLTPVRRCVVVLSSIVIGLFANGVRIALIGYYSMFYEGVNIHGPNQTLYVGAIFFIGMVLLIALSHSLRIKGSPSPTASVENSDIPTESDDTENALNDLIPPVDKRTTLRFAPIGVAGIIFAVTFGFLHFYNPEPVDLKTPLSDFPNQISSFIGSPLAAIDSQLRPFPADRELMRFYSDMSGNSSTLYIGYYKDQYRGGRIIDYRRDWMHEAVQTVQVGDNVTINQTRLRTDNVIRGDVYFWYVMDDRIITSRYMGKFLTFWDALTKRKTNAAVVVVQTRSSEEEVMPFLKELVPLVMEYVEN